MKKHLHYLLLALFLLNYSFTLAQQTPQKGTWKAIQLPEAFETRKWTAQAWTGTEFLYWGGSSVYGSPEDWKKTKAKGRYIPSNGFYFTDGWRINPTTGTCKSMPPSGLPIGDYKSTWTGRYLFVFNGRYMQMKMYDAQKNVWKSISRVGFSRAQRLNAAITWTGKEIMIWGGSNYNRSKLYNDGYLYNPATNRWRKMASAPITPRSSPVALSANKEIIIWGGGNKGRLNDGAIYNPTTDQWREMANNPFYKGSFFAKKVWTGKEGVFISHRPFAYNPTTNQWRRIPVKNLTSSFTHFDIWDGKQYFYRITSHNNKNIKNARLNLETMKEEALPGSPAGVHNMADCTWLKEAEGFLIILKSKKAFFYKP